MVQVTQVLLVEDNDHDVELVISSLEEAPGVFEVDVATTLADGLLKLSKPRYDVVLLDLSLPDADAENTIKPMLAACGNVPLVIFSGTYNPELAIELVRQGAQDFIWKQHFMPEVLGRAIHYAIERNRQEIARIKLEARVQKAQRLESLAILAGGVAHDFNNLLVGILGNAGLALMDLPAESPVRLLVENIETAARRAAELTNQMLAYSGRGKFKVIHVDLSKLVKEMNHLLDISKDRNVVLRMDLGEPGAIIKADATQIRQVVMNLITNAADAIGHRSGLITIRTGMTDATEGYFTGMVYGEDVAPGHYGYIEVSDTGVGMDKAQVAKMFDPYYSTKHDGHGLGLAAMLGIVQGHNGAIQVYSEIGKGTTVKVLLPIAKEAFEIPIEHQELRHNGGGVVLVVDDQEQIRSFTKMALERVGYEVITAADGREGVEMFGKHKDSLRVVLLDMTMPVMEGKAAFKEMAQINDSVPVILMSGYHEQDVTNQFAGRGLAGFIQKPFQIYELLKTVAEV
jgi:signal transduction histidine kinase